MFEDKKIEKPINYNTPARIRARIKSINKSIRKHEQIKRLVAKEASRWNVLAELVRS